MSLTLFYHPLSSFCQKVIIALYDAEIAFNGEFIDFADPDAAAKLEAVWPMLKFPVLRDGERDLTLPESTIIIEYLAENFPSAAALVPSDPDLRQDVRLWDRFFDGFIMQNMQKIVLDNIRPDESRDPYGVEEAHNSLTKAYGVLEKRLEGRIWAAGDQFTMADCAAAPSLFYAGKVAPFAADFPSIGAYFDRLTARPSFARTLKEAEPYLHLFPG